MSTVFGVKGSECVVWIDLGFGISVVYFTKCEEFEKSVNTFE